MLFMSPMQQFSFLYGEPMTLVDKAGERQAPSARSICVLLFDAVWVNGPLCLEQLSFWLL